MTYEQMRTAGWRTFEEMAPEDQAFLSRALGPSLYEIKEAKLLIKKASPATVRVNSAYRMDQTDSSRAVENLVEPLDGICYEATHDHCEGATIRGDCFGKLNPFGYAKEYHYYRYMAANDSYGAWDHKGHVLREWVAGISEFYLSWCSLDAQCPD
ncbi:hypothetical protein ACMC9I_09140 [Deinococcota bacterium DY0809b]